MRRFRVAVVGAGPTGCLATLLLARAGYEVRLFEKRTRAEVAEPSAGRSINLAIPRSTVLAMLGLGVDDGLPDHAVLLEGRVMHARSGELTVSAYDAYEEGVADASRSPLHPSEAPYSVSRGILGRFLLEAAERQPGVSVEFSHRLADGDLLCGHLTFATGPTSNAEVEADIVVGADGAHSTVRDLMRDQFGHRAEVRPSGIRYRELRENPGVAMPGLSLRHFHLWPRPGYLVIALPNVDGSFTFTMFERERGLVDSAARSDPAVRRRLFERDMPDLRPLFVGPRSARTAGSMPGAESHPLVTVRCRPWHHGRAVLVGDACHALLPFSGRGTAEGLADAVALTQALGASPDASPGALLAAYEQERRPPTDALADVGDMLAPLLLAFLPEGGISAPV